MLPQDLQHSDYRIRKLIGTLGLLLPLTLAIAMGEILASISQKLLCTVYPPFYLGPMGLLFLYVLHPHNTMEIADGSSK